MRPAKPTDRATVYEDHCIAALRTAGFRITMPRVQVIRALANATVALSAYAIHEKIVESGGKIDVVSVYRILETLQEVGLIHHVGIADGYVPAHQDTSSEGDASQLVLVEGTGEVREQKMSAEILGILEEQVRELGLEPLRIKIEILAK